MKTKFKVPQPEDYPEIKDFAFQLSNAYSKIYVEFISALWVIDSAVKEIRKGDEIGIEVATDRLESIVNKFKRES